MISIIIPAYNEVASITQTLETLLDGLAPEAQVLVVCNGCIDKTAEVALSVSSRIEVIEIEVGSKPLALNAGDSHAAVFPRIYMDADVRLTGRDICRLAELLRDNRFPAAAPTVQMDLNQVSWAVRSYYRYWLSLPYVQQGMVGCGVYALSEEGRSRFDYFPDVIADDGFVRGHFSDQERPMVEDCIVTVRAPKSLAGLIKIKTRSRLGGRQLRERYPDLVKSELTNPRWRTLLRCLLRPWLWIHMPVYYFVVAASLWRSKRQFRDKRIDIWERDETSRVPVSE